MKKLIFIFLIILFNNFYNAIAASSPLNSIDYKIIIKDKLTNQPIQHAKVILKKDASNISHQLSNAFGQAIFRNIQTGKYQINITTFEYENISKMIDINQEHDIDTIYLHQTEMSEITVTALKNIDIQPLQMTSGVQLFDAQNNHTSPSSRISSLVQENLIGAAKAPTGELHIRGMHGEFTYYLDGIPIPLGVFGGLNEIVDPKIIYSITMMTGGFPAEYGGQMAAILDLDTKIATHHFHLDFSSYAGSYFVSNGTNPFSIGNNVAYGMSSNNKGDTLGGKIGTFRALNSNGQSLAISNRIDNFGFFISATRQESDRRVDIPTPVLFNDHGIDNFIYGKFDYQLSEKDYITINLNYSNTENQIPFDTINTQGQLALDKQKSTNSFQTISYYHTFVSETNSEKNLFIGLYSKQGSLNFIPGVNSPSSQQFINDTNLYTLSENRDFLNYGFRVKFDDRLSKEFKFSIGANFSSTNGNEEFNAKYINGNQGPVLNTKFKGSDFGIFLQEEYLMSEWFRIDAGIRYDQHIAPDIAMQSQYSPRLKFNFFIDPSNTIYLYYGRLFMPTNIEGLRQLATSVAGSGSSTLPEKDDFFEFTYLHNFGYGLTLKSSAFHKHSFPGLDDETLGSSSVKTAVNIQDIFTTGLEAGLYYSHHTIPFSIFLNTALTHAYGKGNITGGFLPISTDESSGITDLDHDQRLSISSGITYQPQNWFLNLTGIYGSGLTNGNPDEIAFKTGLFDFNQQAHVSPYFLANFSLGYTFHLQGETTIEPTLYIDNLFDNNYIMKGAYFSAANWGERRNVILKIAVHI